jgi:hypothetical protein
MSADGQPRGANYTPPEGSAAAVVALAANVGVL